MFAMEERSCHFRLGRAFYVTFITIVCSGLCLTTVFGADFTIKCPKVGFIDGEQYTLQCLVDMNTVTIGPSGSANCSIMTVVQFQYVRGNSVTGILGISDYPTCNTAWVSNTRCLNINATTNIATYEVKYNANNATNNGQSLRCWSDCFENVPDTLTLEYSSCDPLIFSEPCASSPCKNGGTCVPNATDPDGFTCQCPLGFPEKNCDTAGTPKPPCPDCCWLCLLLLLLLLLPIPIPPPWPGYPIYVVLCRIPNQSSSTGSPRTCWHTHYMCGWRTNNVYFSALFVTNDGRTVLIWSRSPTTGRFVWYGTEMTTDTNSSGARHAMDAPPSHRNNVSAESGAVNNGNKHSSQKEKNKHIGTDGSNNSS